MEGNLRLKIDWASLIVGSKFTVFALFYFVFEGNFPSTSPRGAYVWRGDLTEGFLRYRFGELIFGGAYFRNFTVLKKEEEEEKKLTGVASETMPQAKPVVMRPAYNIARFCAKLIRSHPSSKGTEQRSKVLLRPNLSIAHPPMGHPKMAPTATKDCKKGEKKGFVWVCFFKETAVGCPLMVRVIIFISLPCKSRGTMKKKSIFIP